MKGEEKWERRGGKGRMVYGVVPDIQPNGTGFKTNSGCPAPYTPSTIAKATLNHLSSSQSSSLVC